MPRSRGSGTATEAPPAKTPRRTVRRGITVLRRPISFLLFARLDESEGITGDEVDQHLVDPVAAARELGGETVERGPIDLVRLPSERVRVHLADEAWPEDCLLLHRRAELGEVVELRPVELTRRVDWLSVVGGSVLGRGIE